MRRVLLWGRLACLAALASPAAARAGTLWVSLPENAGACTLDRLASLVAAGRTDLRLLPGLHDLGDHDAQLQIFRSDDGWTLAIRAESQRDLVRRLPQPGPACVELLQTAAFMLERYLDEIRWGDRDVPTVAQATPPPDPNAWHGVVELGLAARLAATGGTVTPGPALRLDLGARAGPWLIEVSGLVPLNQPGQPGDSDNTAKVVGVQLAAGRRFPLGPGTFRAELLGGADLTLQSSPSNAPDGSEQEFATTPFLGIRAGWELPLYHRLFAAILVEGRAFYVGEDQPPWWLDPPFDGDASLGLGYLFF